MEFIDVVKKLLCMEKNIHRHNSVIFNYFALIITDFQLFVVSLQNK